VFGERGNVLGLLKLVENESVMTVVIQLYNCVTTVITHSFSISFGPCSGDDATQECLLNLTFFLYNLTHGLLT
jgi:hypothetical protein